MPKGSAELTNARKEEIIAACRELYENRSFKDITLKEIGQRTSFTRTSIYNYFETKEEIFLALLQKEYEAWVEDLDAITAQAGTRTPEELADALARSLEKRGLLLKLMSMNHFDMEANSRMERLVEFKAAYGDSIRALDRCLQKNCPAMDAAGRQRFLYAFLPFVYGLYPYTVVSERQREAMEAAQVGFAYMSAYRMAFDCILQLLRAAGLKED